MNAASVDNDTVTAGNGGSLLSFLVRRRLAVLVVLGALLYVPFLGLRDLAYPDEPSLAEVAQAMYHSGDWVAPRRMGVIWVDYPPMLYWAGVASSHLAGGMSPFSLRLPNALAGVALVALTCVVGSRLYGPGAGFFAGLMLLTFQQFVLQAVGYRPDVLFSLWIAAGVWLYAAGAGERPRWAFRVGGFALLGLAMLAKGPLGLLLPGLVLTLWHGSRREWRRLLELAPLSLVALAVYLPWFVACANAMGADNILHELYAQNVARFFAGARGHAQPVTYFLTGIWVDLFPWSPLLPFALWWVARRERPGNRDQQLLQWWAGAFLVFLSAAVTKRQLYLLPAYPAMALLMAPWLARLAGRGSSPAGSPSPRPVRVYGWAMAALLALLAGVALAAGGPAFATILTKAHLQGPDLVVARHARAPLIALGVVLLASAAWLAVATRRKLSAAILLRVAASQLALYALLLAWLLPTANPARGYREAGEWMLRQMGNETHFGLVFPEGGMDFRKMGGFGYFTRRRAELMDKVGQLDDFFQRHPGSLVLVYEGSAQKLFAGEGARWRDRVVRDDLWAGGRRYLVIRAEPLAPLPGPGS